MSVIKIGKRIIGENQPAFFVADIASNHDGDLERAKELIYLCAEAGADAAKFQNFKAEKIVSGVGFDQLGGKLSHQAKWKKSVFDVYKDASINSDWTAVLRETCNKAGIEYFTSPYDFDSVDLVDPYVNVYKIGSGDITWLEIIEYIAKKHKPVFLATGASNLADVKRAMDLLLSINKKVVLMQCNTNYTGSLKNFHYVNLNVLKKYKELYPETILGLSDHTHGHSVILGALVLGAKVIEKHFTDDNHREGPDHAFAMDPKAWKNMVTSSRELEAALGDGVKKIEENEKQSAVVQRRSLRATKDLQAATILRKEDLEALRPIPKDGIPPYMLSNIVGKKLIKPLKRGEAISADFFDSK